MPKDIMRVMAAGLLAVLAGRALAAFQGNANFRNVAITSAAASRGDWRSCKEGGAMDWSQAETLAEGVAYLPLKLTTANGWARLMYAHAVRVDTSNANLRFTGSDRCAGWGEPNTEFHPYNKTLLKNTVREKTADFLARFRGARAKGGRELDMVFAVNGEGWGGTLTGETWNGTTETITYTFTSGWARLNYLQYSEGVQISNAAYGHATAYCPGVFVVWKDGTIDIVDTVAQADVPRVWCAITPHICRLMTDGAITVKRYSNGEYVDYSDSSVRPRTAYGISSDRRYFYAVVLDGDCGDGWSAGATFMDTARVMKAAGCHQALNMDGGGSSNIVAWDRAKDRPMVLGRPSGGFSVSGQRDGGSMFGVYLAPVAFATNSVRVLRDDQTAVVSVSVAGVSPSAAARNPRLALTVTRDDGTATNVYETALAGAGTYSFRVTGAGFGHAYRVTLVDGAGEAVANAETLEGVFTFGTEREWFASDLASGATRGGAWTTANVFTATEGGKTGRVRVVTEAVLDPDCVFSAQNVEKTLSRLSGGQAQSALILQEVGQTGAWLGLTSTNGVACWRPLAGGGLSLNDDPCAYVLMEEIDFSSGRPRVRYFAGPKASGAATLLADAAGNTAFDGAGLPNGVDGTVTLEGFNALASLTGYQRTRRETGGMLIYLVRAK